MRTAGDGFQALAATPGDPKHEWLGTCLPLQSSFCFSTPEGQGHSTKVSGQAEVTGVLGGA